MTAFIALCLAFAYRLRGGGFVHMLDFEYRILWGSALGLAYIFMNVHNPDLAYALLLLPLAYASLAWIPHAAFQNIGRWATPQRAWPGFFLPTVTDAEWTAMGAFWRGAYDFGGMMGVGLFRGLLVFAPFAATQYAFHARIAVNGVLAAIAVLVVGQSAAYAIGWFVPFSIGKSLTARSTEFGEFLTGAVYGAALWLL